MSLGNEWDNATPASAVKLNGMTVTYGTGTYLAALDKTKHKLVVCTSTSGGLTVDHVYLASADGTTWLDLSGIVDHTHTATTGDGGRYSEILLSNPKVFDLVLTKTDDLKKAQWIETVTGTGTIEDATDGTTGERSIRLRPNGTSGSEAQISYPHIQASFGGRALFISKLRIETATNLAFHIGVGADDITAADSNTIKIQTEVCTVTNNNFWLRTANGSANSASDSGVAIGTSRTGIKMIFHPATPECQLLINDANALIKTTNIPTSGATADNNLIKVSLKNSTAADRPMHFYGARLAYFVSDEWF